MRTAKCAGVRAVLMFAVAAVLAVLVAGSGGCYSRSVKYGDLEVHSYGMFLDRTVTAEAEKSGDAFRVKYSATDKVECARV